MKKQEISTWILAHTQLAQSLEQAWQLYCKSKKDEEECDEQEIKKQQYEKEKNIGQIVQEVWEAKLEQLKASQKSVKKQIVIDGDCTSYNIHQEKTFGPKDVTRWRLSLKDCKLEQNKLNNGVVEIQALEFSEKEQKKNKKPKK